jgi:hypothetical protein
MNNCQKCNHECHCEENCNVENCNCESCDCKNEDWSDNPVECHRL